MAKKKLPIYEIIIDEGVEFTDGVNAVAFVDRPAIEVNYQWFSDHKPLAFKADRERRIVTGPLMLADTPIYRNDDDLGEYNVVFSAETIEKIVKKFAKLGLHNSVNLMHDPEAKPGGVYMIESFIVDSERGITAPKAFGKIPNGSWFGSYFIENSILWENFVKTGELPGFSVEGVFGYKFSEIIARIEADGAALKLQAAREVIAELDSIISRIK